MKINKELLKELRPCESRWKNFLKYYSEFNGSFDEFVDLEKISYDDKIWVARKVLNRNQLCHFGLLCAESVISIFENKHPKDKRVSNCLKYLMGIKDFSDISSKQKEEINQHRSAAYTAADNAADNATYAAYTAAADAATACAYADADNDDADADNATAYATYAATAAATYAAYTAAAYATYAATAAATYAAYTAAADAADADNATAYATYAAAAAADAAYAYADADAARKAQKDLNLELLKVAASL